MDRMGKRAATSGRFQNGEQDQSGWRREWTGGRNTRQAPCGERTGTRHTWAVLQPCQACFSRERGAVPLGDIRSARPTARVDNGSVPGRRFIEQAAIRRAVGRTFAARPTGPRDPSFPPDAEAQAVPARTHGLVATSLASALYAVQPQVFRRPRAYFRGPRTRQLTAISGPPHRVPSAPHPIMKA